MIDVPAPTPTQMRETLAAQGFRVRKGDEEDAFRRWSALDQSARQDTNLVRQALALYLEPIEGFGSLVPDVIAERARKTVSGVAGTDVYKRGGRETTTGPETPGASPVKDAGASNATPHAAELSPDLRADLQDFLGPGVDIDSLLQGAGGTSASLFEQGSLDPNAPVWGARGTEQRIRRPPEGRGAEGAFEARADLETRPAKWWLEQFYKMNPKARTDLQRRMYAGGFYGTSVEEDDIAFGFPDQQSYAAWIDVLTTAARYNEAGRFLSPDDVIAQGALNAAPGDGDQQQPFLVTAPEDVRVGLQARARDRLGRDLTEDEVALFTDYFHEREVAAGQAAGTAEGLTAVTAPPSVAGAAQDWMRRERRAEEIGYSAAERQFEFFDMLRSPVQRG